MGLLTVTAKGQVTLRQELLRHLGVKPGEQIEVFALTGGRIEVRAAQPSASIEGFIGLLAGRSSKTASLEQIQQAAAKGWSGEAITADTNVLVRALLEAGGDFADGVIAHQGQWLGGDTFVSFDRQAVALLREQGVATQLLPSRL